MIVRFMLLLLLLKRTPLVEQAVFVCDIETNTYSNYENLGFNTIFIKLTCPKLPVSGISQSRNNIGAFIEMVINRREIDINIRMFLLHYFDALGCTNKPNKLDLLHAPALEHICCCSC